MVLNDIYNKKFQALLVIIIFVFGISSILTYLYIDHFKINDNTKIIYFVFLVIILAYIDFNYYNNVYNMCFNYHRNENVSLYIKYGYFNFYKKIYLINNILLSISVILILLNFNIINNVLFVMLSFCLFSCIIFFLLLSIHYFSFKRRYHVL